MTKASSFLYALVAFGFLLGAVPAKADTDIYVSLNSPYYTRDRYAPDRYEQGPRHHHHRDWQPEPIYYAPAYRPMPPRYMPPVRPIVYETTIVRPQTQYIVPASVMASQTSPTYVSSSGQMCREYSTRSWIGDSLQNVYGTACLQPDGSWRIVD